MIRNTFFVLLISGFLLACTETHLPKQHGYPQIDFPKASYEQWNLDDVPFAFDKPTYSQMQEDSSGAFWYNLNYLPFNATLHLSFHQFSSLQKLDTLIFDTRNLVYKHTIKASDIIEEELPDSNGRSGMLYALEGETATACNFYLTDNKSKFFRGALYFNSYTTIDSVGPVVDFIKKDIYHMIKTFKFK
jgi:gliding motility-associated lipoprotein GldD